MKKILHALPCKPSTMIGLSLIEVFIAITISLILLAGVLQIFLNTKNSSSLENAYSQLQENGRFINQYIAQIVRLAGYRTPPSSANTFTAMSTVFSGTQPYVTGTHGTGINGSDTLTIRYQGSGNGTGTPDGTVTDCLNNPADANVMVTNIFSLTANNELQCQALNASAATPNNTQILIAGVENFQVLYGEDIDGDYTPDRYVSANYPFLNVNDVISIRLSLLLRSENQVTPFSNATSYYLVGTVYTPPVDRFLRTQITVTILLRNLLTRPF